MVDVVSTSPVAVTAVLFIDVGDCSAAFFVEDVRTGTANKELGFWEEDVLVFSAVGDTSVPTVDADGGGFEVAVKDEESSRTGTD